MYTYISNVLYTSTMKKIYYKRVVDFRILSIINFNNQSVKKSTTLRKDL